jgi:dihydroorotate dehydrogenase electron transfer subunit
MPHDITTPVLRNEDLGHGNFLVEFAADEMAAEMQPAQFFMIGLPGSETLLRRPYSVCGLPGTFAGRDPAAMQVLYKVVGKGTRLLSALTPGAPLRVLGPLGRGFSLPRGENVRPVCVAGGIGSAPFPALYHWLAGRERRPEMLYGARTAGDLPLAGWFEEHSAEFTVTTEDGSRGRRGRVTEPLAEMLAEAEAGSVQLYACGPEPMLKAVTRLAREHGTPCQLALEAHMACGFGVCLGCVVPVRGADGSQSYERVCMEGPVMEAEKLAW